MNQKTKTLKYLINVSFFLYFLLLLVERTISVALSFANGFNVYGDGFSGYAYTAVFVSIIAFFVYLIWKCRPNIKAIFKMNDGLRFEHLCIAGGVLLISGMIHTEYTISGLQFASYGIWIAGILLQTILNQAKSQNKVLLWLSFAYLVAFSMAIPVMYRSFLEWHLWFHLVEEIGSLVLVAAFTFLLLMLFQGKDDLFLLSPIILLVVFDVAIIAMRFQEEINFFVMIFAILSFVLFLVGFIYKKAKAKEQK